MRLDAFLIAFREAFEGFLVVGILWSYLQKIGARRHVRWIWLGTVAAIAASLVVAFLLQVVLVSFRMLNAQIYLKVGIIFFASLMLAYMVLWMGKQAREVRSELEQAVDRHLSTGNLLGLVSLAFSAILREGVETVFFFAAIGQGDIARAVEGWGAISGVVLAGALCAAVFRGSMRVPLRQFFRVSGVLLLLIAAGLFTQGVGVLQDLGLMGSLYPQVYDLNWLLPEHPVDAQHYLRETGREPLLSYHLGTFLKAMFGYSAAPSIEEVAAYLAFYAGVFALLRLRDRRGPQRAAPPAAGPAGTIPAAVAGGASPEPSRPGGGWA